MAKRITLVRHGESESNVTGHWQGQGDSPLSPHGREQASLLAARLLDEGWHFDAAHASDLSRARDTAEAAAARLGLSVKLDQRYREIDVGRWEGLSRPEVVARFPEEVQALKDGADIAIGGGESWSDLARRAEAAVLGFRDSLTEGQHGVVFAHGGFIASVVAKLGAIARHRKTRLGHMSNTSVTTLVFDRALAIERFNDTAHIEPLGAWGEAQRKGGATVVALEATRPVGEHYLADEIAPTLDAALSALSQRHPGERIALVVPDHRSKADEVVQSAVFAPSRGRCHLVLDGQHRALADYNVAAPAPRAISSSSQ
ncbi:MAG: histidine phosphatase family protein [Myxococcota bacterium]